MKIKSVLWIIALIAFSQIASASPIFNNFTASTAPNNTITNNISIELWINITNSSDLFKFIFNINTTNATNGGVSGQNITFYDNGTLLMFGFNNYSAIGENISYAVDAGNYRTNATCYSYYDAICTYADGKYGKALQFDGVNDYASVSSNYINLTSEFTIEGWFKPETETLAGYKERPQVILDKGSYQLYLDRDGKLKFFMDSSTARSWGAVGTGTNAAIASSIAFNDELYVGGYFTTAGGVSAIRVARWNGTGWRNASSGFNELVSTFAIYKNELYAGGNFTSAGEYLEANRIAKWNGTQWQNLGQGANGYVFAMAVYNGELYVGGEFTTAGGITSKGVAKWNGASWSAAGAGINGTVYAFAVYNGELYAGGKFTATGDNTIANNTARWNGTAWRNVSCGLNDTVYALANYNNQLYAGGNFKYAGDVFANYSARWNGTDWQNITQGSIEVVYALAEYAGDLYSAGTFPGGGGALIIWNGTGWRNNAIMADANFATLSTYRGKLYAGGRFTSTADGDMGYIAAFSGGKETEISSNTTSWPSTWHYFAIRYNTTNLSIYVDGVHEININATTNLPVNQLPLLIGNSYGSRDKNNENFNGSIDNIVIYNRSLSDVEIAEHYRATLYKYDTDKWMFYYQKNVTKPRPLVINNYTFSGCSFDAAGNSNCTGQRLLMINGSVPRITVHFTSPTTNSNLGQGNTLNMTMGFTCIDNWCGNVNSTLDPFATKTQEVEVETLTEKNETTYAPLILFALILAVTLAFILFHGPEVRTTLKILSVMSIFAAALLFSTTSTNIFGYVVYDSTSHIVSTATGATPFYTTSDNPSYYCANITENQQCNVSWIVKATGSAGTYAFFTDYNSTEGFINNKSSEINITITVPATTTPATTIIHGDDDILIQDPEILRRLLRNQALNETPANITIFNETCSIKATKTDYGYEIRYSCNIEEMNCYRIYYRNDNEQNWKIWNEFTSTEGTHNFGIDEPKVTADGIFKFGIQGRRFCVKSEKPIMQISSEMIPIPKEITDSDLKSADLSRIDISSSDVGTNKIQLTEISSTETSATMDQQETKLAIENIIQQTQMITDQQKKDSLNQMLQHASSSTAIIPRVSKSLKTYEVKNIETGETMPLSKVVISVSAPNGLESLNIVEVIPKNVAENVAQLTFSEPPEVIQPDPIVKWYFDDLPPGESKDFSYTVDKKLDAVESTTVAAGSVREKKKIIESPSRVKNPLFKLGIGGIIIGAGVVVFIIILLIPVVFIKKNNLKTKK